MQDTGPPGPSMGTPALTSVVMKSFERLVLAHLKDITGPLLAPLQLVYEPTGLWMMQSTWDCTNILQHMDKPGDLCKDPVLWTFDSAFSTIIPDTLQNKLTQLSVPTSICQWITSFLTDRQQLVRLGKPHIQHPHHQHWSSSGLRSLPTAILSLHK